MPEVVDIDEESKKYKDEWVLFEVTEVDEHRPVKGRLLCHSESRDEIHEVVMKVRDSVSELGLRTFFTGDLIPLDTYVIL